MSFIVPTIGLVNADSVGHPNLWKPKKTTLQKLYVFGGARSGVSPLSEGIPSIDGLICLLVWKSQKNDTIYLIILLQFRSRRSRWEKIKINK